MSWVERCWSITLRVPKGGGKKRGICQAFHVLILYILVSEWTNAHQTLENYPFMLYLLHVWQWSKPILFLLKFNLFLVFLFRFDILMLKIKFKNKKYYFNIFSNKKHYEKQKLPHYQAFPWPIIFIYIELTKYKQSPIEKENNLRITWNTWI